MGKGTSPSRHFVALDAPKSLTMGSKRAHFTCLCTPNGLVIILEKRVFDPFLTLFGPQKAHFQGFLEFWSVITGHHGLKTGQKHLFGHPKWSRNKFGKNDVGPFLDPQMTHVTLPWHHTTLLCQNGASKGDDNMEKGFKVIPFIVIQHHKALANPVPGRHR